MKKALTLLGLGIVGWEIYQHHIAHPEARNKKELKDAKEKIKDRMMDTKEKLKQKVVNAIDEL